MRNRAKCKLCASIIESFHTYDYVSCKCGEISISGGNDKLECSALHWENFLRVDENGNEIAVKVADSVQTPESNNQEVPIMTLDEKIDMLKAMTMNLENLPKNAMLQSVTHYELYTYMIINVSIFEEIKSTLSKLKIS